MVVFQVSLNFDPVKEILKVQRQIYILVKKVINIKCLLLKKVMNSVVNFFKRFSKKDVIKIGNAGIDVANDSKTKEAATAGAL